MHPVHRQLIAGSLALVMTGQPAAVAAQRAQAQLQSRLQVATLALLQAAGKAPAPVTGLNITEVTYAATYPPGSGGSFVQVGRKTWNRLFNGAVHSSFTEEARTESSVTLLLASGMDAGKARAIIDLKSGIIKSAGTAGATVTMGKITATSSAPVPAAVEPECPPGQVLFNGSCVIMQTAVAVTSPAPCPAGQTRNADGACVPTSTSQPGMPDQFWCRDVDKFWKWFTCDPAQPGAPPHGAVVWGQKPETKISDYYAAQGVPVDFSRDDIDVYKSLDAKYQHGIGTVIQDGWSHPERSPILEAALTSYVDAKFPHRFKTMPATYLQDFLRRQIQDRDPACEDCKIARYEFIGFFVPEYLKMLRTGSNPALRKEFSEYAGYNLAKASRRTLDAWAYYSRRDTAGLNEPYVPGEHFGDGPALVSPEDLPAVPYKPNTLSVFIDTAEPLPGKSVADFKECCMEGSPLYLSAEEEQMFQDIMLPVMAHSYPEAQEGLLDIPDYLYQNVAVESRALNILESVGTRLASGAAIGGVTLFGASLGLIKVTAVKFQSVLAKQLARGIGGRIVAKTFGALASRAMVGILIGVAIFAAGFQNTGGKAIELAVFENNLKRDCYYKPQKEDWMSMSKEEKIVNFTLLLKMLVLQGSEATISVPKAKADLNEQKRIEGEALSWALQHAPSGMMAITMALSTLESRYLIRCAPGEKANAVGDCIREVKFHGEAGLTQQQARERAAQNGWTLATEDEVLTAWTGLKLDVYAFGMLADGRFAVPVQASHSNFNVGANIGATGGNQGFFYTQNR